MESDVNKPQELLSDVILDAYVSGLERDIENIKLLQQLKRMSETIPSEHIKNNYKIARIEQFFYCRRLARKREGYMMERVRNELARRNTNKKG
ncbi:MAG TPA: hypothetical protein GX745_07245 [Clostridiales bacterium]|nr:hypothetical protein [Clostridiales bacterium]